MVMAAQVVLEGKQGQADTEVWVAPADEQADLAMRPLLLLHRIVLLLLKSFLLKLVLVQFMSRYAATKCPDDSMMHHMPGDGARSAAAETPNRVCGRGGE